MTTALQVPRVCIGYHSQACFFESRAFEGGFLAEEKVAANPTMPGSFKRSGSNNSLSASARDDIKYEVSENLAFTVVVLGASGDLAKKKTFPALFTLFDRG